MIIKINEEQGSCKKFFLKLENLEHNIGVPGREPVDFTESAISGGDINSRAVLGNKFPRNRLHSSRPFHYFPCTSFITVRK